MVELQPSKLVVWVRFPSPASQGNLRPVVAAVAQLVERFLGKDEVMGSSPISSFWRRDFPLSERRSRYAKCCLNQSPDLALNPKKV
jgi:hypothetical protein